MLGGIVVRSPSVPQVPRKTADHDDAAPVLVLPEVVNRELDGVRISSKSNVQDNPVGLRQPAVGVAVVAEELLPLLVEAHVGQDGVDAAELGDGCVEAGPLRCPGRQVALVEEDPVGAKGRGQRRWGLGAVEDGHAVGVGQREY